MGERGSFLPFYFSHALSISQIWLSRSLCTDVPPPSQKTRHFSRFFFWGWGDVCTQANYLGDWSLLCECLLAVPRPRCLACHFTVLWVPRKAIQAINNVSLWTHTVKGNWERLVVDFLTPETWMCDLVVSHGISRVDVLGFWSRKSFSLGVKNLWNSRVWQVT